jgi:hypothetical protein
MAFNLNFRHFVVGRRLRREQTFMTYRLLRLKGEGLVLLQVRGFRI